MGQSYFASNADRKAYAREVKAEADQQAAKISTRRRELAAKIVMAVVDRIVNEVIRPGPVPEERECYEVAGEVRALGPVLEELAKQIIDVNDGVA